MHITGEILDDTISDPYTERSLILSNINMMLSMFTASFAADHKLEEFAGSK